MDFEYVTRGRSTLNELFVLGGLNVLTFLIVPILTLTGYFYESFVNIIQGKKEPPQWEYLNLTISGLIPFAYLIGGGIVGMLLYVPALVLDSAIVMLFAVIYWFAFSYAFPALVASYRIDMSPLSMILSTNYAIGVFLSGIVYFGLSMALGVIVFIGFAVFGGGSLLFIGGLASLGDPFVLLFAFFILIVVGIVVLIPMYGASLIVSHIGLVPLGERIEKELNS